MANQTLATLDEVMKFFKDRSDHIDDRAVLQKITNGILAVFDIAGVFDIVTGGERDKAWREVYDAVEAIDDYYEFRSEEEWPVPEIQRIRELVEGEIKSG